MNVAQRARGRSRRMVGTAKLRLGQTTGNRRLAAKGRRDRMVGSIQETGSEVRQWATDAAREARRRFSR